MFPGYLFVQMKPDEASWYLLRRLPGVAKLVGTRNEPTPVSQDEIDRILRQLGEKMKKIEVDFELNEAEMTAISALNRNRRFNDPGHFCEEAFGTFFPIYD